MDCADKENFHLCPKFEQAFKLLGKKWTGLIIEVLLTERVQYFGELNKKIPMLSERILAERLKELEADGILMKTVDECKNSHRLEYSLTEKGQALSQVMHQIKQWAEQWIVDEEDG